MGAFVTVKNGPIGLDRPSTIRQRQGDGLIYFGTDEAKLYQLVDYSWDGPLYGSVSNTQTTGADNSQTTKKGKTGKMTAGVVVGALLLLGIETVASATISAGGKGKSVIQSTMSSNPRRVAQQAKQAGTVALKLRRVNDGTVFPISIAYTTEIDAQIRCFQIIQEPPVAKVPKDTVDAPKGIKALKELLDMGAASEGEFEFKKK